MEIRIKKGGHKHNYTDISRGLFRRIIAHYNTDDLKDMIELELFEKQLNVIEA